MSLEVSAKIGKKFMLHLPKKVVDYLKVKEVDRVKISVEGNRMIVEVIRHPIRFSFVWEEVHQNIC